MEPAEGSPEPRSVRIIEDRWSTMRHIVEAVAIIAAGFWAFYTFVYQERIKPASQPGAENATVSIHRIGRDATREFLSLDIVLLNTGKTEVDMAADGYNIWGLKYGSKIVHTHRVSPGELSNTNDIPLVSDNLIRSFIELRYNAIGGHTSHIVLEPGSSETLSYIVVVPRGVYDTIRAQVVVVPVKFDLSHHVRIDVIHNKDGSFFVSIPNEPSVGEDDNDTEFALNP